jgi:hypothetical protein
LLDGGMLFLQNLLHFPRNHDKKINWRVQKSLAAPFAIFHTSSKLCVEMDQVGWDWFAPALKSRLHIALESFLFAHCQFPPNI